MPTEVLRKAALYLRVSTNEQKQHGLSIDNQRDALIEYCKKHHLQYEIYNDAGISGHISYRKRPALLRLISDCQQGRISVILFTRLDRWFRSIKDYYLVADQLAGVPWRAIWEDYETETSSGQLKVNIMLSIAEAEAARTSEKIKSVMEYKADKGEYVGGLPTGYIRSEKGLVKDPATKDAVEAFFSAYLATFSVLDARLAADARGLRLRERRAGRILRTETYAGSYGKCLCEPYITPQDHARILDSFSRRRRTPKRSGTVYLFSGLCRCGYCGCLMAGKSIKNRYGKYYGSYRCNNGGTLGSHAPISIGEIKLETYLIEHLDDIIGNLRAERLEASPIGRTIDECESRRREISGKMERLTDLYVDGEISREVYSERKNKLAKELAAIEDSAVPAPLPELPAGWREIYQQLSKMRKRIFWQSVVQEIIISTDKSHAPSVILK